VAEQCGETRGQLMRHLLRHKTGASIDELSGAAGVTRTAVRQHLASLMSDGLVADGGERPSGGRPQRLFVLTPEGRESFPRRYSWFAQLLIEAIAKEAPRGLRLRLAKSRRRSSQCSRGPGPREPEAKVEKLSEVMDELG
jgi:predicted ArsR family transcriptional regulator